MEPLSKHKRPHFHAYYQGQVAVIAIDEIALLAGTIPQKQLRLTFAWAELHKDELIEDWNLLQSGNKGFQIEPLK